MSVKKTVLIVTDGTDKVTQMAEKIAKALKGNRVLLKIASEFAGTDLLPAGVVFLGCSEPSPLSFKYLDELLHHINLAGRSCGIFSPSSAKALQYLKNLLKSSDIALNSEPMTEVNSANVNNWAVAVLAGK